MKNSELEQAIGGLSQTSKMPCPSWSISAKRCNIGGKLAEVKGSICEGCYALKGAYAWGNTQVALEKRWDAYTANPLAWRENMAQLITRKGLEYFRWFDSGDLQSVEMLEHIVAIAEAVPWCKFWLPTKELAIVSQWTAEHGDFPANLNVRLSAYMRDKLPPSNLKLPCSTVTDKAEPMGFPCPSKEQGNTCSNCRACWSKDVPVVSYFWH
jgi:hypothetical protein